MVNPTERKIINVSSSDNISISSSNNSRWGNKYATEILKNLNEKPLVPKFIQEIYKSKSILNNWKKTKQNKKPKHKTIKESSPGRLRYSVAL